MLFIFHQRLCLDIAIHTHTLSVFIWRRAQTRHRKRKLDGSLDHPSCSRQRKPPPPSPPPHHRYLHRMVNYISAPLWEICTDTNCQIGFGGRTGYGDCRAFSPLWRELWVRDLTAGSNRRLGAYASVRCYGGGYISVDRVATGKRDYVDSSRRDRGIRKRHHLPLSHRIYWNKTRLYKRLRPHARALKPTHGRNTCVWTTKTCPSLNPRLLKHDRSSSVIGYALYLHSYNVIKIL